MQKQFNKTKPDNLFTYGNKTTSNEDKYDDMDKFAKTLLTSSDWGASALKFKKNLPYAKVPFKPTLLWLKDKRLTIIATFKRNGSKKIQAHNSWAETQGYWCV